MAGTEDHEGGARSPHEEEGAGPDGAMESDDTTMADAGLVGGTGAQPGQSSVAPYGTEKDVDDDEAAGGDEAS